MKRITSFILIVSFVLSFSTSVFALNRDNAINEYKDQLRNLGMESDDAQQRAEDDIDALIENMEATQDSMNQSFNQLEGQVQSMNTNDPRRERALSKLDRAEDLVDSFRGINAENHITVLDSIGGVPPQALPDEYFSNSEESALKAISDIHMVLISPKRPGAVPEGDIVEDFIPQIIRQLFRFAWVAILIALVASGVMLIIAHDNDERVTKAKQMILYSLIGFAFIALAFAIVKGVTDIDFFRFI